MGDDGSENGGRMDRNLYLGFPSLPRSESRELASDLTAFSHASAFYSPSNALSTPDILPADPLPAVDPAAVYSLHSSSQEPNAIIPDSQQPLDEPSTVLNLHGHETLARETSRLVPLRELVARPWARDCDSQTSSSSPPQPFSRSGHGQVESVSAGIHLSELTAQGDALSLHQELREHPEHRFQLLIELLETRRSITDVQGINPDAHSLTSPERLMHAIMQSQRAMETAKKAADCEGGGEDLEKTNGDIAAANFECNICYELAKAPVVTPCGHLYCWSCLYQWLHAHSVNSECPVCKGQVLEVNVTPIYGRGGEETKDGKHRGGVGESNLKIPPRPPANRVENLRSQSRERLEEGITNSWRNNMDEETHDGPRADGSRPSRRQGRFGAARTVVRRRPVRSLHEEEDPLIPIVVFPEGHGAEPSRQTAGSVMVVDQASTSTAIAASLGGTTTASPAPWLVAAMPSNSVRRRARNPALAASGAAGGAHHTRRRMR